jgi:hypothetical protein
MSMTITEESCNFDTGQVILQYAGEIKKTITYAGEIRKDYYCMS